MADAPSGASRAGHARRRWHLWAGGAALALAVLGTSSCVYFNTFYNAQKYYRQAERARAAVDGKGERSTEGARTGRRADPSQAFALYEKAVRKASIVLDKYPDSDLVDDAMYLIGRALYWQGDYQYSARSFRDLELSFAQSEYCDRARLWRARCLERLGTADEARAVLRALVLEGSPAGDEAGLQLGDMALAEGDTRGAIDEYRATLELFPDTAHKARIWLCIGEAQMALGTPAALDEALAAFDRALESARVDSVEYRARLNRGRAQYLKGQPDAALASYDGLLRNGRFRAWEGETRILVGQYYRERGLLTEALREFEHIRDDFPQTDVSAMALYETGLLYLQEMGERRRAEEYFEEVTREKRGSLADSLGGVMLRTCDDLAALLDDIYVADSTAASLELARLLASGAGTDADRAGTDSGATASNDSGAVRAALPPPAVDPVPALVAGYVPRIVTGEWIPLVTRVPDQAEERADAEQMPTERRPRQRSAPDGRGQQGTLLERLFATAELYRDELGLPDSAAVFYGAIADRYPESDQVPRALYSLAWIHFEQRHDPAAARPYLARLVSQYGSTAHANAARRRLDLPVEQTAEDAASALFADAERDRGTGSDGPRAWITQLDEIARSFPATRVAARAAFLAAWATENAMGDSAAAQARYDSVVTRFPNSTHADIVRRRRQAQNDGLVARLERELKGLGLNAKPGERLGLIAAEPDSADSAGLSRKYLGLAMRAHRRGQLARAEGLYQLSLDEQTSGNGNAVAGMGDIAWQQGYFEDAVTRMRTALKDRATSLLPQYRLFAYHVRETQPDSANHYLRLIARQDRDNPDVRSVLDRFPTVSSAEPENIEMDDLETLDLKPADGNLRLLPGFFGIAEPPFVRASQVPEYPAGATDSAAVVVDVLVSDQGRPEQVDVFSGEEPFASAARAAVTAYLFYPAEDRQKQPVSVWVEVEIPFAPPALATGAAGGAAAQ